MNINYRQPQFELFPANSATLEDVDKPRFLLANLTLSLESLVIFSILAIMVALFSFSLGVERGKHLAAQALDERVSAAWNVGARTAAQPAGLVLPAQAVLSSRASANNGFITSTGKGRLPLHPGIIFGTGRRFTLQAATYRNEEYARQDALLLKAKGFQSFLIKTGGYWLLCVGSFSSKESAASFLRKLPQAYRGSQVRPFFPYGH